MKRILAIACLFAGAALLSGCAKKATTIEPPTAGTQVGDASNTSGAGGASTSGKPYGADATANGRGLGDAAGLRSIIYFDFDKSDIKPEFLDVVSANARNLTNHPNLKVKLEGNTDERGTREYNIGLGERRAQAVRRALLLQGVADSQISTVSFGSERPAAEGDDEAAWSKNRRVELVYRQ
jgi:peptidoglycan-associated lipoprotein